jgi:hypothetical protein
MWVLGMIQADQTPRVNERAAEQADAADEDRDG